MGFLRKGKLTTTQLIRTHIKLAFAGKCAGEGRTLGNDQLLRAFKGHYGVVVNRGEPPRCPADQVPRAATMRQNGGSAQSRVEALISNLENFFLNKPQAGAFHRTTRGTCSSELAKHISLYLVAGCSPSGFQELVKVKL